MDLRLDHNHRRAEIGRCLGGLLDREGRKAARRRHAELAQHRLGLVFVDVHRRPAISMLRRRFYLLPRLGAIVLQASTSVATACTDLSNIARSVPLSWISTMRSTPLAPITAGTPT